MSVINILCSKIYNIIAAGEVVERPASVVKELVENSLDAGATSIEIEITGGGINSIRIRDNGSGIPKSELKKALMPHATSKISKLSDLDSISSLGFRGEALASIASVSKITIISRTKEQELGAKIYSEGGLDEEINDCGASLGTEILVNNLFFNTPAREKFLRTERGEESEITSIVSKFILGNTSVAFKYVADNKVVYQSYGDGFESAMACIYGFDIINNCFYIDTEKNGIKINGYIGKLHYTKGNRSYQSCFINSRIISNQTVSSAISNAYSSYLMKRQYPFYVLSLTLSPSIVDVNVHPNKLDVRFSNNQVIYSSLYSVISKVLDGTSDALNIVSSDKQKDYQNTSDIKCDYASHTAPKDSYIFEKPVEKPILEKAVLFDSEYSKKISSIANNVNNSNFNNSAVIDIFAENKAFLEKLEKEKASKIISQEKIEIKLDLKFIGQALNTYLIFEDGLDLYFVDQHAAHERILFDRLNQQLKDNSIVKQPLLLPFILNLNSLEYEFINSKLELLSSLGFEVNEFGNCSFKVSSVPSFLVDMNIKKFFDEILSDLSGLKQITFNSLLTEKIAQKACKSAVKSGDKLSEVDIQFLTDKIKENVGLKCPHGRPVVVKISRVEIDKWFKRII